MENPAEHPPGMVRYSRIDTKLPREMLLLRGRGCFWRRCRFCDYYHDVGDPAGDASLNAAVLARVTGEFGTLDVINSGSAMELDDTTLAGIAETVRRSGIRTLWFEAHYRYRDRLAPFAERFAPATVRFRCGIETFDGPMRTWLGKGIPESLTPERLRQDFAGICLLAGFRGQTREMIRHDIATARRLFDYASVNLFCDNTTPVRRDPELVAWFMAEMLPTLHDDPRIEILVENTDLQLGSNRQVSWTIDTETDCKIKVWQA